MGKSTIKWPFSIAMLNYQRVFCKDLLTTPVVCEWSVFRGQIICEFGSSSLSLFLPVVAQIPHFDGWTFLFVWLHLHISYVFQCISNVFPVAKVMLSLNFPFFPVKLQPPRPWRRVPRRTTTVTAPGVAAVISR